MIILQYDEVFFRLLAYVPAQLVVVLASLKTALSYHNIIILFAVEGQAKYE